MSSEYRIHRPYVLAVLPRPLDHTDGRILAREVFGQRGKRRTELAVGIDGETVSLYDVPASQLITSYPIPPQDSFTCPPYSVRFRRPGSNDVVRCTLISTKHGSNRRMTLFKDTVQPGGKTVSTTASEALPASPVIYMAGFSPSSESSVVGDIVAVCQNGEFVCLCGETLGIRWSSWAKSTVQDVATGPVDDFEVEYVSSASLADFRDGMCKDRPEILSTIPKGVDPTLFVMVARSTSQGRCRRHLVILAALAGGIPESAGLQRLIALNVVPIGDSDAADVQATYQFVVQSGLLMECSPGNANFYDVNGAVPKHRSTIQVDGAESFLRLSKPFVLTSSPDSLKLFNYQHRSCHAGVQLDLSDLPSQSRSRRSCQLITHLRSQDLVVALMDNVIVTIQIEPPKALGKRRRTGLLIDSIGRGVPMDVCPKKSTGDTASFEFSTYVPGTMTETYATNHEQEIDAADELLRSDELGKWEDLLRQMFNVELRKGAPDQERITTGDEIMTDEQRLPEWDWVADKPYPSVDRRWVLYAISRVFSVETPLDKSPCRLRLLLGHSNVMTYLVVAGHLSLSNLIMAFRTELSSEASDMTSLTSSLVDCIIEAEASMTLLFNYLKTTKLGEVELLLALRKLMLSMDLISENKDLQLNGTKLLGNEDGIDGLEMDLDDLEREIAVTEHYLGDESSSRSRGITLALTKLWRLPAASTVRALRATMQKEDMLALIQLLRVELVRGAWTSLYVDTTGFEYENHEPPPDGVIMLIADLLGRCLDAMGAGGWLFNDAVARSGQRQAGDLLAALKLEVSAALEGIEGATNLSGVVGEAVRFGRSACKSRMRQQEWKSDKPMTIQLESRETRMLPLGLKVSSKPSADKVVSGGEVVQRSLRETGHLISRNVESYTIEKSGA